MKLISNRWLHIFISLAVTACLLYVVVSESGVDGLLDALRAIDVGLLSIYLSLSIIALLMRAYRYRIIVDSISDESEVPSVKGMLVVTAIRNALVDFLPARLGELSYLYVYLHGVTEVGSFQTSSDCYGPAILQVCFTKFNCN